MLTNEEIKKKIDYNNNLIEDLMDPCTFTLNEAICKLMKENDALRAQCAHEYNEEGICIYCYSIKE